MALFACGTTPKRDAPAVVTRGCELHTTTWRDQPTALATGGKPFVDVLEVTDAKVMLATRTAMLRTRALTVTGTIADLQLHAAAPFLLGGYAVPGAKVPLRLVSSRGDAAEVELVVPFTNAKVTGAWPCRELALDDTASFAPRAAVTDATTREAYVHAGRDVPLSLAYGKPAVVTLRFVESPRADVLAEREASARVAIHSDSLNPAEHVLFVGWVPRSVLHADAHGFGGSWATGGDRSAKRDRPVPGAKVVSCAQAVALDVELDGVRRTVGTIAANAVIEVLPDDSVRIRDAGAELLNGARWLVAKTALADCVTRP